jgi:hypothetical protein
MPTFIEYLIDIVERNAPLDAVRKQRRQQREQDLSDAQSIHALATTELQQIVAAAEAASGRRKHLEAARREAEERERGATAEVQRCTQARDVEPDVVVGNWERLASLADYLLRTWNGDTAAASAFQKRLRDAGYRSPYSRVQDQHIAYEMKTDLAARPLVEVADWTEIISTAVVKDMRADDNGHPVCATVETHVGPVLVTIRSAHDRFVRGWKPNTFNWVPTAVAPSSGEAAQIAAIQSPVVVRTADGIFYVPQQIGFSRQRWNHWPEETVSVDFDDVVVTDADRLCAGLGAGRIDIDWSAASPAPFTAALMSVIRAQTNDVPPYERLLSMLAQPEVERVLSPIWNLVRSHHWSGDFQGPASTLKYLLEEGFERPRAWSCEYAGQYGFRMRTRDHTWLHGEVYVLPSPTNDSGLAAETMQLTCKQFQWSIATWRGMMQTMGMLIRSEAWYLRVWEED